MYVMMTPDTRLVSAASLPERPKSAPPWGGSGSPGVGDKWGTGGSGKAGAGGGGGGDTWWSRGGGL